MKSVLFLLLVGLTGITCASAAPKINKTAKAASGALTWNSLSETNEAEYAALPSSGTGSVSGQGFLTQAGGGVVKAAGATVNLDPATAIGNEWWDKEAALWASRKPDWAVSNAEQFRQAKDRQGWTSMTPPSTGFNKARRSKTADADGRFSFTDLPPGKYYISTTVSWTVGYAYQGGLVGQLIEVKDGGKLEAILNQFPKAIAR